MNTIYCVVPVAILVFIIYNIVEIGSLPGIGLHNFIYVMRGNYMKISFIGGKKRLEAYYRLFCDRSGFDIVGFYCNPLKDCADIAVNANACLFTCIDDLCKVSDVIFICTEDEMLPAVIKTLTKSHINNKIIVSPARQILPNDLDNGYENTCVVIDSPVSLEHISNADTRNTDIIMCGAGKDTISFFEAAKQSGINIFNLSKPELELYRVSYHILYHGIRAVLNTANKLSVISANTALNSVPVIKNVLSGINSDVDIYKNGHSNDIAHIINTLNTNGIESITGLYKSIAETEIINSQLDKDIIYDMYKALNK